MTRLYDVNVRAVVNATRIDPEATGAIEGWEVYDFEGTERNEHGEAVEAVYRCDQFVSNIEAGNAEDAAEIAMMDASPIVVSGWVIDSVNLWVDFDNEDVVLVQHPLVRR
ncbi:hypothetical protein [Rhizobium leguminosarum]|uniref:hypothetical protein n=1 Tax=Rhizobium leguminosarum TaxID=384 RepID=UPI002E12B29F|nr:hypothetical protein U8Q02_42135 [Rhizobium leguminosarum]